MEGLELVFDGRRITLTNKRINKLDEFVFKVSSLIEKYTEYVIVSGYVSILFGRSRGTEDIDFVISSLSLEEFRKLYEDFLNSGFEFINSDDPVELFEMLIENQAVRACEVGTIFPNAEIKLPKDRFHLEALKQRIETMINDRRIFISPIELQIAYKLYLGSEKDIEDAIFLYELFRDHISHEKLQYWKTQLGVEGFEL
ncbi:hypothetical protein K1720_03135 [Thermococcus argininiproducens]|uniref:Nucleotidyltransferase n=1 Tax=Thermococcus argininiproducens TaxID=2866384 RepID=A0A9E7MBA1_9EURY|nr:hypothetical protein [Thermococcus argininiproducens]USH00471.1 hypothetical protein K1720_03135 [Thermococcus argininiproducens]